MLNGIDINVVDSILSNRNNSHWLDEICGWETIVNLLSKHIGFNVVYWTFDPSIYKSYYISTNNFRNDLMALGAEDFTMETNGKLVDSNFGERGHIIQFEYFLNNIKLK